MPTKAAVRRLRFSLRWLPPRRRRACTRARGPGRTRIAHAALTPGSASRRALTPELGRVAAGQGPAGRMKRASLLCATRAGAPTQRPRRATRSARRVPRRFPGLTPPFLPWSCVAGLSRFASRHVWRSCSRAPRVISAVGPATRAAHASRGVAARARAGSDYCPARAVRPSPIVNIIEDPPGEDSKAFSDLLRAPAVSAPERLGAHPTVARFVHRRGSGAPERATLAGPALMDIRDLASAASQLGSRRSA